MTNEPLNIGDMVVWCNPYKDNAEECCGVIVEITETDGDIYYNVDWFEHNRTPYHKEFLRKIS